MSANLNLRINFNFPANIQIRICFVLLKEPGACKTIWRWPVKLIFINIHFGFILSFHVAKKLLNFLKYP